MEGVKVLMPTYNELIILQNLDLKTKIRKTKQRIREWYEYHSGNVYVSFSGGKDSTVLLDIVRSIYPDVEGVFSNTGLEFPEIVKFAKSKSNITEVRARKSFRKVIEQYGYPIISKKTARMIRTLQKPTDKNVKTRNLYMTGITSKGKPSPDFKLANKWMSCINAPFKISEECCNELKKKPMHEYQKISKKVPFIGTMADESRMRRTVYLKSGCNSYEGDKASSTPLGFWTEQDILEYIKINNLEYCSVYGNIVKDANDKWVTTGETRTGCMFCMFGVHLDHYPNRFQRMQKTHQLQWDYCINKLGLKEVLEFIHVPYKDNQLNLFEVKK